MNSTIEITSPRKTIPSCTPNLMPFHIQYTGPAPVSTFFQVKDVDSFAGRSSAQAPSASLEQHEDDAKTIKRGGIRERFKAAFRGRVVCGLKVELPEGFSGIVLKADSDANERSAKVVYSKKANADIGRRRSKRGSAKDLKDPIDIDELDNDATDESPLYKDGEDSDLLGDEVFDRRALEPISTFNSLVVWHPDISVDEGKDEYIRAMTEWTGIAAEVGDSYLFKSDNI